MDHFQRLHEELKTNELAITYLQSRGLLPLRVTCSKGHEATLKVDKLRERWRCFVRGCREERAVRFGTFLENSRLPYSTIVKFIYAWANEMVTIKFCQEQLGMNKNTVVHWCNYMREICAHSVMRSRGQIGGPGMTVEIDESPFSWRKHHKAPVTQNWVIGGICRESRQCFLVAVPDTTAGSMIPVMKERIAPGSNVILDQMEAYKALRKNVKYNSLAEKHSLNFVKPSDRAHSQSIGSLWGKCKVTNKKRFGAQRTLLDSYMCEFIWRRSLDEGRDTFDAILQEVVEMYPPSTSLLEPNDQEEIIPKVEIKEELLPGPSDREEIITKVEIKELLPEPSDREEIIPKVEIKELLPEPSDREEIIPKVEIKEEPMFIND